MRTAGRPANYCLAGVWGAVAAAGYAAQHPLQKPFVDGFDHAIQSYLEIALYGEIVLFAIFLVIVPFSKITRDAFRYMSSGEKVSFGIGKRTIPVSRLIATVALSAISVISVPLYSVSLKWLNPIYLSLILNLYPVYNLFVAGRVHGNSVPLYAYMAALAGFAVVATTQFLINPFTIGNVLPFLFQFLIVSLVPILFSLRSNLFARTFGNINEAARVLVMTVFDAPLAAIVLAVILATMGSGFNLPAEGELIYCGSPLQRYPGCDLPSEGDHRSR